MKAILFAATMFVLAVPQAQAVSAAKFRGTWNIDFDRTMEEVKKSPKYKADDSQLPTVVRSMMAALTIRIAESAVIFVQGSRELSVPYRVQSGNDASVVLAVNQDGKDFTLTLTLVGGAFMNLKSSGSDDLDYYVWTRATDR